MALFKPSHVRRLNFDEPTRTTERKGPSSGDEPADDVNSPIFKKIATKRHLDISHRLKTMSIVEKQDDPPPPKKRKIQYPKCSKNNFGQCVYKDYVFKNKEIFEKCYNEGNEPIPPVIAKYFPAESVVVSKNEYGQYVYKDFVFVKKSIIGKYLGEGSYRSLTDQDIAEAKELKLTI